MSRWSDSFQNHPFWDSWRGLVAALTDAKIDDESILTSVEELARLRKVITFVNGLLTAIDPELVPSGTWTSFQDQSIACLQQIQSYNNNRNVGHLNNANGYADNLLTYVRPWVVIEPSDAVVSMKTALETYHSTLNEYSSTYRTNAKNIVAELEKKKNNALRLDKELESVRSEIEAYKKELFEGDSENKGIKARVAEIVGKFETEQIKINQFFKEALIGDESNNSIKNKVLDGALQIQAEETKARKIVESISKEKEELEALHLKIFGDRGADDENQRSGLDGEIKAQIKKLEKFYDDQNIKHTAQFEKIESLLPSARSAGLAAAFHEMKKSFDEPIRYSTYTFYGSLFTIIIISMYTMIDTVNDFHFTFVQYDSLGKFAGTLGWKLPLIGVGVWLALFASKRRSEALRLQQEYAHKETLAKSYDGFKKQIDDLKQDDQEMLKSLMNKAIESIADNASKTLDGKHDEKTPLQELVDTVTPALGKIKDALGSK